MSKTFCPKHILNQLCFENVATCHSSNKKTCHALTLFSCTICTERQRQIRTGRLNCNVKLKTGGQANAQGKRAQEKRKALSLSVLFDCIKSPLWSLRGCSAWFKFTTGNNYQAGMVATGHIHYICIQVSNVLFLLPRIIIDLREGCIFNRSTLKYDQVQRSPKKQASLILDISICLALLSYQDQQ